MHESPGQLGLSLACNAQLIDSYTQLAKRQHIPGVQIRTKTIFRLCEWFLIFIYLSTEFTDQNAIVCCFKQ